MLAALLIVLVILWVLGYISIPFIPNFYLFTINAHRISLWDLLTFLVVAWVIGILPSPFRQIAFVLLILWTLSTLGIIGFVGLPSLILIAIIIGIVIYLLGV